MHRETKKNCCSFQQQSSLGRQFLFQFFVERVFNSKEKIIFYQVLRNRFNQGNLEVHKYYNQPFTIESMEEFMELEEVELLLKERGLKIELKRIE